MSWLNVPTEIYLYGTDVDFQKSINGLVLLVEQELKRSAFEPALFVFCNRGRDKIKALYWDRTGFALWYKRLERHLFKWPKMGDQLEWSISQDQFQHWLTLSGTSSDSGFSLFNRFFGLMRKFSSSSR